MRKKSILSLATIAALTTMLVAAVPASAKRFQLSDIDFYLIWDLASPLELQAPIGETVSCGGTFLGTFHGTVAPKTVELRLGYITHAEMTEGECLGGDITVRAETLPWQVRYRSFTGTLPTIATIRVLLVGASFRVDNGSATCDATTTVAEGAHGNLNLSSGTATSVSAEGSIDLADVEGSICDFLGANGIFTAAPAAVSAEPEGRTALIVRLV